MERYSSIPKISLVYPGCLGVTEIVQFYQKASLTEKHQFDQYFDVGKLKEAVAILEQVLDIEEGKLWSCMNTAPGGSHVSHEKVDA